MCLHGVGCDRELFASDAVAMLHEATLGALRDFERDTIARVVEVDSGEAS